MTIFFPMFVNSQFSQHRAKNKIDSQPGECDGHFNIPHGFVCTHIALSPFWCAVHELISEGAPLRENPAYLKFTVIYNVGAPAISDDFSKCVFPAIGAHAKKHDYMVWIH